MAGDEFTLQRLRQRISAAHAEPALPRLHRGELLKLRRGVFQVLIEFVGKYVEIAVVADKPAIDTAIVSVADTVKLRRIGHRQRPQQNPLHERKDGRSRPDAESQSNDRRYGESRRLAQLAQRITQVLKQGVHEASTHTILTSRVARAVPQCLERNCLFDENCARQALLSVRIRESLSGTERYRDRDSTMISDRKLCKTIS